MEDGFEKFRTRFDEYLESQDCPYENIKYKIRYEQKDYKPLMMQVTFEWGELEVSENFHSMGESSIEVLNRMMSLIDNLNIKKQNAYARSLLTLPST